MSEWLAGRFSTTLRRVSTRSILLLIALVAVASFAASLGREFFSTGTLKSMAFQLPELGILALAMMVTMLSGGINLAVVATANFTSLAIATLLSMFALPDGSVGDLSIGLCVLAGLTLAGLIGLMNGFIIAYIRVSPILTTLGTMTLLRGISVGLTHGSVLSGFPGSLVFVGNGTIFEVPAAMVIFLLCCALVGLMLSRTQLGSNIYMVGSNERATGFSGVDTQRVILKVYSLSGLLCGIAAIVMMGRFNSANASYGESYLLVTILAAVLGGVDPFGGFGGVGGVMLALLILQMTASGFNLLGFSSHLTLAIWGLILLSAVALNVVVNGKRSS